MTKGLSNDPTHAQAIAKILALSDQLTLEVHWLLDALAETERPTSIGGPHSSGAGCGHLNLDPHTLRSLALALFTARRARLKHFPQSMFNEIAWDMLLALYIRDWSGARFTAAKLCSHVRAAQSSGFRWLNYLESQGLIERQDHPNDGRKTFVALSTKGRDLLSCHLTENAALLAQGPTSSPES